MKIIVLSAILLLIVGADRDAHASTAGMFDDDVIRVLFVIDHSTQLSKVDQMISHLNQTWQRYNWEPGTISLEVVNRNSPIMKPSPRFSGNKDQLVDQLKAYVEQSHPSNPNLSIRDFWGADIVIGLAQDIPGFHGWAPMDYWIRRDIFHTDEREFVENCVQGCLDLRGSEEFYLAMVDQDAGRSPWVALRARTETLEERGAAANVPAHCLWTGIKRPMPSAPISGRA